jgi:DNA-binding CsgD family transcriptional regulator
MSTRGLGDDLTLDSYLLDLDAVLEQLDIQRFVLMGSHFSALLAAHYAARHPERVEALILNNTGACWQGADIPSLWLDLPLQSWDAFLYSLIPKSVDGEVVEQVVQSLKRWVNQADYLASTNVWRHAGLEDVLEHLHTPTLVLKPQHCPCSRVEAAVELASRLPNGRLFLMDSDRPFGAPGQAIGAIESFLAEVDENRSGRDEGKSDEPSRRSVAPTCLTSREVEVLRLLAAGRTNRAIADELVLSLRTVERHITNMYAKISARGRADATSYAIRNSLT